MRPVVVLHTRPLCVQSDNSPEDLAREMEKQVNALIEASADAALQGDAVQALERAKEAVSDPPPLLATVALMHTCTHAG